MKITNIQKNFNVAKKLSVDNKWLTNNRAQLADYVALRPIKNLSESAMPPQANPIFLLFNFKHMIPIIIIAAMLLGGSGAVMASQNDVPGDTLYSVKIATEQVREALTFSPEKKAKVKAEDASHRTEELATLTKQGKISSLKVVNKATDRFQELLKEVSKLVAQLSPEQKLQLTPQITALLTNNLPNLDETRLTSATSTYDDIDEAVQTALQTELEMSEDEESVVKEQPSLRGLQERAQHKISEVAHKIAETKKEMTKKIGVASTTTLIAGAEATLLDAQSKFAAAFTLAGDAQQAVIQAKKAMEQAKHDQENASKNESTTSIGNDSDDDQDEVEKEEKKDEENANDGNEKDSQDDEAEDD